MKVLVLHHNDPDGIASGLVVKKYEQRLGNEVDTIAVHHSSPVPVEIAGADKVVIVDFAFPVDVMTAIAAEHRDTQFVVIDHHEKVCVPDLPNVESYVVSGGTAQPRNKKAGIDLTLERFPVKLGLDALVILRAIGRRDVWDFSHADFDADAIVTALYSYPQTIAEYEKVIFRRGALDSLTDDGRAIIRYRNACIENAMPFAESVQINGRTAFAINTAFAVSETGNALAKKAQAAGRDPIGIVYAWSPEINKYQVALRSIGATDVAEIARSFGGGGHINAAGFRTETLPWR
jgi:nanoRNase/pAp phosphatase (c-di-AMP/oligoRNAs hydrolase)